jgi:hypothetical protein
LGSFGFVSKLTSALVPSGWLAQLGSFGISRLSGKGVGSFWFVFKATSALVPSGWSAPLGSFGISGLSGKGRSSSGVTMADCAPYRLQSKRSATGIEEDARPVTELGVRGPRDSHLPQE